MKPRFHVAMAFIGNHQKRLVEEHLFGLHLPDTVFFSTFLRLLPFVLVEAFDPGQSIITVYYQDIRV